MTDRVRQILSWYRSESPGVQANIYRFLMSGRLAGTGKLVMLPVDQGFEHGPARSFSPNPAGFDPRYHFQLAIDAGCNAYAAPLGLHRGRRRRLRRPDPAHPEGQQQRPALRQAPKRRCRPSPRASTTPCAWAANAIGFTIYPGSGARNEMYEELRELAAEAKAVGLAVVVWSYPRGGGLTKEGETAVDVSAYAAQIAAQLGAHIIKVKPPANAPWSRTRPPKAYEKAGIPVDTLTDRVKARRAGRLRRPAHRHLLRRRG